MILSDCTSDSDYCKTIYSYYLLFLKLVLTISIEIISRFLSNLAESVIDHIKIA